VHANQQGSKYETNLEADKTFLGVATLWASGLGTTATAQSEDPSFPVLLEAAAPLRDMAQNWPRAEAFWCAH
tara:strand:- start:65 stop:280 length:216 start_codon:yes stop_codon:yes gene_type:complete